MGEQRKRLTAPGKYTESSRIEGIGNRQKDEVAARIGALTRSARR